MPVPPPAGGLDPAPGRRRSGTRCLLPLPAGPVTCPGSDRQLDLAHAALAACLDRLEEAAPRYREPHGAHSKERWPPYATIGECCERLRRVLGEYRLPGHLVETTRRGSRV